VRARPGRGRWLGAAVLTAALLPCAPRPAHAQDTAIVIHPESAFAAEPSALPRPVAEAAVRLFNAPNTTRIAGRTRLPDGNVVRGDLALRSGDLRLGGRVEGNLLVINGDAILDSTAVVTGDVTVIGGTLALAATARIAGEVHTYRDRLDFRTDGDQIALELNPRALVPFLGARKTWEGSGSRSDLTLATGGTFNRIEGLPIVFGPQSDVQLRAGPEFRVDALGIARSVGSIGSEPGDLGYVMHAEVRSSAADAPAVGLRFRARDVVAPIEDWGLQSAEVGWAAFLFQRDYRDYYLARGVQGGLFAQPTRALTFVLSLGRESQANLLARDPWTLFRNSATWRANPPIDGGHYTTLTGRVTFDTRNDPDQPTAGWFLSARVDNSWSPDVSPELLPASVREPIPTDGSYEFSRFVLDARRYTRISPTGRVNLRLYAAGWLGGDALPLQDRLSLGGADPLPGYGFRHSACNGNLTDPALTSADPAACDRVLFAQVEYRGHLSLRASYHGGRPKDEFAKSLFSLEGPDLVVFGDGGQAWLVGDGPGRVPNDRLPTIGSWLGDLGLGMDWSGLGLYVAKGVTGEPLRFSVRLNHRF